MPYFELLEDRRLLSDGYAIDPTYGTGGRTTIGAVGEAPDYVSRLIPTPASKLLVLGSTGDATVVAHLTQFNLDGTLDSGFGGGGRKILTELGAGAGVVDAVVGGDGRILVMRSGTGLGLARYLADGAVDASFAAPSTTSGTARDVALSADGTKYYAVTGTTISRLTAAGGYDTTFDGDGQLTIAQEANFVQFTPMVVQPLADGSILVGGQYGNVNQGIKRASFRHYNANGTLDTTFGTLGAPSPVATVSTPGRLVLQPDGKVVAVVGNVGGGQGYVMRINAPVAGSVGSFDSGFGSGFLFTPELSSGYYEMVGDVKLDQNGRLVGTALAFSNTNTLDSETALFRLNINGTLDASFGGAGSGYKRHVFDGLGTAVDWGPREVVVNALIGRIYTATSIRGIASAAQDQYLERFMPAGDVDATFGAAGKVRTSYDTPQLEQVRSVLALPDDSIVFVGNLTPTASPAVVAKLNPDGTPAAFGTNGVASVDFGSRFSYLWDAAPAPGGKLVAVGRASFYTTNWVDDFGLARFNPDGQLDPTFGNGGKVVTNFPGGDFEQFNRVFVAGDGTIYAAGVFQTLGTSGMTTGAIVRYTPSGQVDTSFGTGGILKLDKLFADSTKVGIAHIELVGGKLLIAGSHDVTSNVTDSFIARLGLDGVPDPTFGTAGIVRYHVGAGGYPGLTQFVTDPVNGRYLTLDLAEDQNYIDHAYVRRYTLDGQLDTAWADGGMATVTTPDTINDLTLLPDGRIRLTGSRVVSTSSTATNREDLLFIGLTAGGALDLDFGVDGFQTLDLTRTDRAWALLPVAGGRFVAAGTQDPTGGSVDFGAVRLTTGADVVPPRIASATADYATRRAIVVQFSESVLATLTKGDLTVERYQGYSTYVVNPADYTFEAVDVDGATRLTITLAAGVPDADFDVYLPTGAVADAKGNATTTFLRSPKVFFLAGDANHDRTVNFADLLVLARNYNKAGMTFDQGDFDYNGVVNFNDLLILARAYNTTLAAPAAAPVMAAASAAMTSASAAKANSDDRGKPVFSVTPVAVARPAPAKPKVSAKPARR